MEEIKVRETGSQREEDKHNQEFIMLPLEGEGSVLSLQDLYRAAEKGRKLRQTEEMRPCKRAGL